MGRVDRRLQIYLCCHSSTDRKTSFLRRDACMPRFLISKPPDYPLRQSLRL